MIQRTYLFCYLFINKYILFAMWKLLPVWWYLVLIGIIHWYLCHLCLIAMDLPGMNEILLPYKRCYSSPDCNYLVYLAFGTHQSSISKTLWDICIHCSNSYTHKYRQPCYSFLKTVHWQNSHIYKPIWNLIFFMEKVLQRGLCTGFITSCNLSVGIFKHFRGCVNTLRPSDAQMCQ